MASAEKSEVTVTSASASESESVRPQVEEEHIISATNWHPGYRARFPRMGAFGMLGVVLCAIIIVIVLVCSDGVSSTRWPQKIKPGTIINGISGISNLCLGVAIAEGVAIAWWRRALKGATVAELHQSWSFSASVTNILRNFWRLDRIALAALATKLAIVDGILFQDATSTYTDQDPPRNAKVLGAAAQTFPQTGYVVAQGYGAQTDCDCFMIGDAYTPTVDTWENSTGFFRDFEQYFPKCNGICHTHVDAIGFEIDCQRNSNHTNVATAAIDAYNAYQINGSGNSSLWTDLYIFNTSFYMEYPDESKDYASLNLDLLYFDSDDPYDPNPASCPGTLTTVSCSLRPALVRYPMTIVNYNNAHIQNGVSIGGTPDDDSNTASPPNPRYSYPNKQADGFQVLSYLNTTDENKVNSTTHLGGIANALSQFLTSSATITYTGGALWGLNQKGTLSQSMMYGPPNMGSCDCSFRPALDTLVSGINQLTFLTATSLIERPLPKHVSAGTEVTVQGVTANTTATFAYLPNTLQIKDVIHYQTNYIYMGVGLTSMVGCLLLILPSFWRYGELGRQVTLGPMEIASAFRAPMLETGRAGEHAVGNVEQLIEQVGDRKVVYGFVEEHRASVADGAGNASKRQSVRLCMEEPARVRPVSRVFNTTPPTSPRSPFSPRWNHPTSGKI